MSLFAGFIVSRSLNVATAGITKGIAPVTILLLSPRSATIASRYFFLASFALLSVIPQSEYKPYTKVTIHPLSAKKFKNSLLT